MEALPSPDRTTSSLAEANNDTGPHRLLRTLRAVRHHRLPDQQGRGRDPRASATVRAETVVKGTGADEVAAALAQFDYEMTLKESYMSRPRKERPTLWTWMQKPRNVWAHYILAVHKGKEGHWILIKGVKMCDTYTEGRWTFVVDGPHRGARIMEVFEVRRSLGV